MSTFYNDWQANTQPDSSPFEGEYNQEYWLYGHNYFDTASAEFGTPGVFLGTDGPNSGDASLYHHSSKQSPAGQVPKAEYTPLVFGRVLSYRDAVEAAVSVTSSGTTSPFLPISPLIGSTPGSVSPVVPSHIPSRGGSDKSASQDGAKGDIVEPRKRKAVSPCAEAGPGPTSSTNLARSPTAHKTSAAAKAPDASGRKRRKRAASPQGLVFFGPRERPWNYPGHVIDEADRAAAIAKAILRK